MFSFFIFHDKSLDPLSQRNILLKHQTVHCRRLGKDKLNIGGTYAVFRCPIRIVIVIRQGRCRKRTATLVGNLRNDTRNKVFLKFLTVPLAFLALGCLTIVVNAHPQGTPVLAGLSVGSQVWGITRDSAFQGLAILSKSLGAISAMYFLALNTPVTDLTMALEKLHVPRLLVELMELIYRFIFVLAETAEHIHTAQDSRLGYQGFRRSVSSLGMLASMVFLRSWRKAERIYTALESRGYTGSLTTLAGQYRPGWGLLPLTALAAAGQIAIWFVEGRLLP